MVQSYRIAEIFKHLTSMVCEVRLLVAWFVRLLVVCCMPLTLFGNKNEYYTAVIKCQFSKERKHRKYSSTFFNLWVYGFQLWNLGLVAVPSKNNSSELEVQVLYWYRAEEILHHSTRPAQMVLLIKNPVHI